MERLLVAWSHVVTMLRQWGALLVGVSGWLKERVSHESLRPSVDELVALMRRYLIQETIGPLKAIAKGVLIALGGALLFGLGGVVVLVGVLRVLQGETGSAFAGNWSFVPYVVTAVAGLGLIGLAALATIRTMSPSRTPRS